MILEILLALSTGILGIFVGAQIAEAILIVPYWKMLPANDFFNLHQTFGKKLYQFFAPLTIAATLIPLLTVGFSIWTGLNSSPLLLFLGVFTLLFFSTYFLYFKKANQSFADRSLSDEALSEELGRWGNWHWARIVFELLAFSSALILLVRL